MTSSRSQMIAGMLGFSAGTFPFSYLKCPIFKGTKINLWTDNWLGNSLLELLQIPLAIHNQLRAIVADIIADGALLLPAAALMGPTAPLLDSLVWLHSSNSKLTSKLALNFLKPAVVNLPWAAVIWKSCIPPAHSFILWCIMHGKIPTDENLRRRGCINVSICSFCLRTDESYEHLFLHCPFAKNIWLWLGGLLHTPFDILSFAALLGSIPQNCSSQIHDIHLAAVIHSLHGIWMARNSLRFTDQTASLHSTKVHILVAISFSGNISTGKCIVSDANILDALLVSPHNRRVSDILMVYWKAPLAPWIKLNTDGSLIGSHAACGGLFRDHRGSLLGAFVCNIGTSTVFYAEVYAFLLALEYAAQNGWRNVWLESDSTIALLVFKNRSLVLVLLHNGWHNVCNQGIQIISSHVFREGNCCAYFLANMGHTTQGNVWLSVLPQTIQTDFFLDRSGFPRSRLP
ncbi:uncharacterized protein [Medicago truncatula]|uniref:uncharacterized protein n=1 Tax=Medicago truncatula TaxID=3880 RepID=UPI000D2F4391|nr:uncharacterized protein LOC112422085 [Medicago truncatula]